MQPLARKHGHFGDANGSTSLVTAAHCRPPGQWSKQGLNAPKPLNPHSNLERLCRPLAGTRRRGKTPAEDVALEKELLADEKECSEHVMLVDLGRNDVGKARLSCAAMCCPMLDGQGSRSACGCL